MRRLVWLVAVLATACGPDSYEALREQLVDASCSWARRCGYVGAADRAACPVDEVLALFGDSAAERALPGAIDVAASIGAGRRRYDSVNAKACLDAVSDAPCDPILAARAMGLACNAVVSANTETDQVCFADEDCTGGICARQAGCAGTCIAYASPGAPCTDEAQTPQDARCDPTVAYCGPAEPGAAPTCQRKKQLDAECADNRECVFGYTCRSGHCVEPIEVADGEPCGGDDPCERGLYCDPTTLLCARQHRRGEACTSRLGCEDGLGCLGLVQSPPGGPPPTPGVCGDWLDVGRPCTEGGLTGCPTSSQVCKNGACVSTETTSGEGQRCDTRPCAQGLACDESKLCDFAGAVFAACSRPDDPLCEPGLRCSATPQNRDGQCLPPDPPACFNVPA